MKIEQLSVFIENKSGRLAHIAETLGESGINIRAMSLSDTANFGILRLIVDDIEKARQRLRDRGFTVRLTEVVAVRIPDQPGSLGGLLKILETRQLNIEYVYGLTDSSSTHAILILRCDDMDRAVTALQAEKIQILDKKDVMVS